MDQENAKQVMETAPPAEKAEADSTDNPLATEELIASLLGWREQLTDTLEQMPADAFQRLILQMLARDGVRDIDISSANGKIEGNGTFGGGGFLSFRVAFRCIRGGGRISSAEVEDFRREVVVGRADKGLLITTGKFTQEAILKAASDRAPEILLIDGEELIEKLKQLKLGVRTEQVMVERVIIETEWFGSI